MSNKNFHWEKNWLETCGKIFLVLWSSTIDCIFYQASGNVRGNELFPFWEVYLCFSHFKNKSRDAVIRISFLYSVKVIELFPIYLWILHFKNKSRDFASRIRYLRSRNNFGTIKNMLLNKKQHMLTECI